MVSNHATAVASRLFPAVGSFPINGGVADPTRWQVLSYQATNSFADIASAINVVGSSNRIINMSLGGGTGAAAVSAGTAAEYAADRAAWLYRDLVVISAGNSGSGASTITSPGTSYNAVTVGATDQNLESPPDANFYRGNSPGGVSIASFSSRGTTPDNGRHKPDIVAPGTNVTMAAAYENNTPLTLSNTNTLTANGTSFSAPYVAGLGAHLIEEGTDRGWNTDPVVIKAVMLNSAQQVGAWTGWTPGNTTADLDVNQGAGEASTPRADIQYLANPEQNPGPVKPIGWDYDTLAAPGSFNNYVFTQSLSAGSTLQATMDWFRENDVNQNPFALDNFYLELWSFNGNTPVAMITQSNSNIDSVQDIHRFAIPADGTYGLRVHFVNDNDGAIGPPDEYGLAWYTVPEPGSLSMVFVGAGIAATWFGVMRRKRRPDVTGPGRL